jgi:hypothetical protein
MQQRVPGLTVAVRAIAGCSVAMGQTGAPAGRQARFRASPAAWFLRSRPMRRRCHAISVLPLVQPVRGASACAENSSVEGLALTPAVSRHCEPWYSHATPLRM